MTSVDLTCIGTIQPCFVQVFSTSLNSNTYGTKNVSTLQVFVVAKVEDGANLIIQSCSFTS